MPGLRLLNIGVGHGRASEGLGMHQLAIATRDVAAVIVVVGAAESPELRQPQAQSCLGCGINLDEGQGERLIQFTEQPCRDRVVAPQQIVDESGRQGVNGQRTRGAQ